MEGSMKKAFRILGRVFRQACSRCFGMGTIEVDNGGTIECRICKGKGLL